MADLLGVTIGQIITLLGYDGTAFRNLLTDAAGHLQVDALSSELPVGASTLDEQQTQTTALQLIDDLRNALQSVDTDKLQVRGKNQLFSYKGTLESNRDIAISGANGYAESNAPGAGEVWCVERVSAKDYTTATTMHTLAHNKGGAVSPLEYRAAALALNVYSHGPMIVFLDPADVIRVGFTGGAVADTCRVTLHGYIMTKE